MSLPYAVRTLSKVITQCPGFYCSTSRVVLIPGQYVLSSQFLKSNRGTSVLLKRNYSDTSSEQVTEGEQRLTGILQNAFPKATEVHVRDISGGCGSMYEVYVVSEEFRGVRTVMQHRMINEALKDEIKEMHGLRISTTAPEV